MIVEIAGVKVDVDERTARTVESYRVGDRVKVLRKEYQSYKMYPGVIVGFAAFAKRPTIEVMYLDQGSYSSEPLKFLALNAETEDVELAPLSDHELTLDRNDVIERIDDEIRKRRNALEDMEQKRRYFIARFSDAFPVEEFEAVAK